MNIFLDIEENCFFNMMFFGKVFLIKLCKVLACFILVKINQDQIKHFILKNKI